MASETEWQRWRIWFLEYRAGDAAVVAPLFGGLTKVLRGYFAVRTQSQPLAEDLTQVALLKIHYARESFRAEASLRPWIFTIAQRCLVDHWRGKRDEGDEIPETPADGALSLAERLEFREDLIRGLDRLKPIDRSIVYLYAVEGLSMAELAQSLGLSEGAAKVRAHRSYKQLREFFAENPAWLVMLLWEGWKPWR